MANVRRKININYRLYKYRKTFNNGHFYVIVIFYEKNTLIPLFSGPSKKGSSYKTIKIIENMYMCMVC